MISSVGAIRTFATLVVAAGLVAGCTSAGGADPTSSPPPSTQSTTSPVAPTTSSASTSPTPTAPTVPADVPTTGPNTKPGEKPPVMPVAATEHTQAGAEAFAKFFIAAWDWGYATTSSAYMRHYYEDTCVACRSAAVAIDDAANKNHHFIGDRLTVKSVTDQRPGSSPTMTITFDVTSTEVVDSNNKFVDAEPALPGYRERITSAWRAGQWVVVKMVPL